MGGLSGMDMAINNPDLDSTLRWHLTGNHYPPLPVALVAVAKKAIERAMQYDEFTGDWLGEGKGPKAIRLPKGMQFQGKNTISVADAVESMHLDCIIEGLMARDEEEGHEQEEA